MEHGDIDTAELEFEVPESDAEAVAEHDSGLVVSEADAEAENTDGDLDVEVSPELETDAIEETAEDEIVDSMEEESENVEQVECAPSEPFDYTCDPNIPETCPGGFCIPAVNMCIAPQVDPDRWADCGDDACGVCETAEGCPADCGDYPSFTGEKEYDNDTTITVWVHGFYNKSADEMASMVYGEARGCGAMNERFIEYGLNALCSDAPGGDTAPNHAVKVEYYGGVPDSWLSEADVAEIEQYAYDGPDALKRYSLVLAKFIRHRLEISGATHVRIACHSMGCYVTRNMLEHDIEQLASQNKIVRWFATAGVLAGARLARLYDNPDVQNAAGIIGMELSDFVVMNPDYTMDWVTVWNHKPWQGDSPYFKDMIIHHSGATNPHIEEAIGFPLLDVNNPDNLPNDGIMYTDDEYFHDQRDSGRFTLPSGDRIRSSLNLVYVDHMTLPDENTEATVIVGAAQLGNSRKVKITLREVELLNDREKDSIFDISENGYAPAEIAVEVEVRYNPYIIDNYGRDVLIHDDKLAYRTPNTWTMTQGETQNFEEKVIYYGPIFDDMESLQLHMKLLEVDWYLKDNILEYAADVHEALLTYDGQIPLNQAHSSINAASEYARIIMDVDVYQLY